MASRNPLRDALSSISVEQGSRNRFTTTIDPGWTTQHSVLGGFLEALMLSTGREYIRRELEPPGGNNFRDPIHVFVQFLRMIRPGPVRITCTTLRVSARLCVVRVEVSPVSASSSSTSDVEPTTAATAPATVSVITYGDLSREKGLSQTLRDTRGVIPPPADRLRECVEIDDPVVYSTPVTRKLRWVAPKSSTGLWGHRLGGHQREVWLSFRDGSAISDILHLALLSDMPLQPPATHQADFYFKYALSTLCISTEFKKRPDPDTQWVMVRSNSHKVSNGRYDVNIQILDETGDILALSNHVAYISKLPPSKKSSKI